MTQNLKIEVLTGDISIEGMVVTNLVTKEELSTAIVKKADLGADGKIPTSQLPAEIVNTAGIVDEVKLQLETSIKDAVDESNAYAESYADNALVSKADLVTGKVPLEQLPAIDQYPQFGTSLTDLSTAIMKDVRARTDELEKTKASLGEDGKVLRELIPSYEKISGLPEQLEVMTTQTAAVSKELGEHKVQTADQIDVLKENIEANVQQLTDRQSHLMRTYATKELGVDANVGVKPGEYFYVRSTNEEEMLVEYQNAGGSVVATGKSYPNGSFVETIAEHTALPFKTGKSYALHERVQLENGAIVKSTIGGNTNDPNINMTGWVVDTEIITPDQFIHIYPDDDFLCFGLAATLANAQKKPLTLLNRVYELKDQLNLNIASYGIVVLNTCKTSATTLKATSNPSNKTTFCVYKNIDRRKFGNLFIDANGLYDVAFDTSYDLQVGPSLNITFENIFVKGYKAIGWNAENNSDVYFKQCAIFEPKNQVTTGLISIRCNTRGGPAQFTCCNFLRGKVQVAAQHIEMNQCVTRGLEFLDGSWNVYSAVGTHHFADTDTNALFIITGEVFGFNVLGGLCEANNDGFLFHGNGGKLVASKYTFADTRVSPDVGKMYLQSGSISGSFGNVVVSFDGGYCGLDSNQPQGFIADLEFKKTNYKGSTISREVVSGNPGIREIVTPTYSARKSTYLASGNLTAVDRVTILASTGSYQGTISFLNNRYACGEIHISSYDMKQYSVYKLTAVRDDLGVVQQVLTMVSQVSGNTNKISAYIDAKNIHVSLPRDVGDTASKNVMCRFVGMCED